MPRQNRLNFTSNGIKLSCLEWGKPENPTIVCVHGLTGNAQDFKFVGEYFAARSFHLIAVDMPGRGESEWIGAKNYNFDVYISCLQDLLEHFNISDCVWLGVSMGGLLGIRMAAHDPRVQKLVLVDVGPEVPKSELDAISLYLTYAPVFETLDGVIGAMKQSIGTSFYRGPMTEDQWKYFAESSMRKLPDGRYTRSFDPAIADNFRTQPLGKTDLWADWEKIEQPVLAIRGELSLLFPERIAVEMRRRKKGAAFDFVVVQDAGHVPSLYPDDQIEIISSWLLR